MSASTTTAARSRQRVSTTTAHSLARRQQRAGRILVLPALVLVAVFVLFPLGFAFYISLTNWPLIGAYHYVGFSNYTALIHDVSFRNSVLFTVLYTVIVTIPIFVIGYLMAMFVRSNRRGAVVFRTLFFLPYVVGLTAESFILVLELQPTSGAVNGVLKGLHLGSGNTAFLVTTTPAILATSALVVWFASGLTMVLLISGMQSISKDTYEAAEVDGAGFWARELRITIPLLKRTIALSLILSVIGSLLAFNQFYILTQGGPGSSTTTVIYEIYNRAFVQLRLGSATAMSIVLVIVIAIITAVQFLLLRDDTSTERGN